MNRAVSRNEGGETRVHSLGFSQQTTGFVHHNLIIELGFMLKHCLSHPLRDSSNNAVSSLNGILKR